jgi:hypothetical protein
MPSRADHRPTSITHKDLDSRFLSFLPGSNAFLAPLLPGP